MNKCAFLSTGSLEAFECYDDLLIEPFRSIGWQVDTVSWRNKSVDWETYDAVIIRSCWDYQQNPELFLKVIREIENTDTLLANSYQLVEWNIRKSYLRELEDKDIPIVPTLWRNNLTHQDISTCYSSLSTDEIVIKPVVGANADHTFRLKKDGMKAPLIELKKTFKNKSFLVQPFIKNIVNEGEYSLFYFNGKYSHAILKTPRSGDYRVQEEHGGTLKSVDACRSMLQLSDSILRVLPECPLYARLDFVRNKNEFQLMEVELIEPSLYFNMDSGSPCRFAEAFNQWQKRLLD